LHTLRISEQQLQDFDRHPFRFEHELANHEALKFDSLREIVLSLPREQVFATRADLKIDADFDRAHIDHAIEHTLEATLADMATTNSYVMVRQPDSHPRLRPILEVLQAELAERIKTLNRSRASGNVRLHDPMLYLFISSPNSVTPFHVDRYSTWLLQLQGEKDVMIWERDDRRTVTEEELEFLFGQPYVKNPTYKSEALKPNVVHLKKSEAVHIPFTAPHSVKNGSEVSVSLSFICQTPEALRDANAFRFNYSARRLLGPLSKPLLSSVGKSEVVDNAKANVMRVVSGIRRRIRG
jgi:hypothetical protein